MRFKKGQEIIDFVRKKKKKIHNFQSNNVIYDNNIENKRKIKYEKLKNIIIENKINDNGKYDFLSEEIKSKYQITDTENISDHDYCNEALELIKNLKEGLILDCGAGLRKQYYENVINYEICDYITTDVLGVGEELPFKDDSFDAVFSFAVLEHVTNPIKCANEIVRVLKPNGILIFDACFMQPMHGYPDHYFNITPSGAKLLFKNKLLLQKQYVSENFHPIYTLMWYLNMWLTFLPDKDKKEFLNLKIKDINRMSIEEAKKKSFCKNLLENHKKFICAGTRNIFIKEK